ncbi:MAG: phage major capsid protein [Holosporales bacterium]|jgi:HK97 family phage major capsid protein|nr:phage major capsid protein [Holosporales bacterium]
MNNEYTKTEFTKNQIEFTTEPNVVKDSTESNVAKDSFLARMDALITEIEESIVTQPEQIHSSQKHLNKETNMLNQVNTQNQTTTAQTKAYVKSAHSYDANPTGAPTIGAATGATTGAMTNCFYAEKPHSQKAAFLQYLATGETCFGTKGYLLSRDEAHGGYLVPEPTLTQIDSRMKSLCPMRLLAKVDTIRSESLELLIDRGATDAGWMITDELADGGTPDLAKIKILTHPLYAKPKASQKILDDIGERLEDWIVTKIAQKVAALENHAFLHGDGEHKPKGLLTYAMVPVGEGTWETMECVLAESVSRDSLLEMVGALRPEYLSNAAWLMSRSALSAIQQISDAAGRFLWHAALATGEPSSLLGYPVVVSDDMPKIAEDEASVPVLFGDFASAYQIVDRGEISVLRDPYSAKPYVEFYATRRVGGDVVDFDAVKALHITR